MIKNALKPCPFCGSTAHVSMLKQSVKPRYFIVCGNAASECIASGDTGYLDVFTPQRKMQSKRGIGGRTMAEFVKTMEEARRLCAAQENCEKCPIWYARLEVCRIGAAFNDDKIVDTITEGIILSWAKEHPEPVYPSWEEGWRQLFPMTCHVPCPNNYGPEYRVPNCMTDAPCTACKSRPMPAEVAEKLGIKPIDYQSEGVHNGCVGCKYGKRSVSEEPCAQCRGWEMITSNTNKRGDLWEEQ